ncbi:GGDEF domain-containing protein [Devosia sp.]|uniref:GGDEF domain-containing protein n=1 Tax=Devosia sp. TaxID=1871048 RepID=UPI002FCBC910
MFQVDVFSFATAVMALLLAGGLLIAYAINRSLTAFGWWAGAFVLLALWLATSTMRLPMPAVWIKWLSWSSFYAAACLVAYGLHKEGYTRASPVSRMVTSGILLVVIATGLTILNAPPPYWLLLGPVPVLVFMTWSTVLVFRAGAWGYGLTLIAGIGAVAIRSLFHPGGLARVLNPPPPPALRGGYEAGSTPGEAIALQPRPPINGLIDFAPPPGLRPPVEHPLIITLFTVVALLALAVALVLRHVLAELNRMRERSTTDAMTGLLNRAAFEEAAAARLRETRTRPACVILLDIDHFKRINDTSGHAAGDRVISRLGLLLRQASLPHAIAGRIGGEEFAVILSASDLAAARLYAEAVRAGLSAADFDAGISWKVTVSAGIAMHQPGESLLGLMDRADRALYAAKATGRDRVVVAGDLAEAGHWHTRQTNRTATA